MIIHEVNPEHILYFHKTADFVDLNFSGDKLWDNFMIKFIETVFIIS